ncbi:predicted protein [Sclerotinia sclerotiorum 1980 UF-70]|uniref:Uncharacterized protein n=1 Tax=Sclerotinia sclerotiorum (strain ATCC 18683 / 1980 / Ss-1) TaxID=665079 RepID=A7EUU0_SCLS1|nr:predicted protein [Sclerotinia sclerotiorum 1980 UF-70]EDN93232.1 predicted protein [Sclerotinia sclerotiorum 1980 UF-70]
MHANTCLKRLIGKIWYLHCRNLGVDRIASRHDDSSFDQYFNLCVCACIVGYDGEVLYGVLIRAAKPQVAAWQIIGHTVEIR